MLDFRNELQKSAGCAPIDAQRFLQLEEISCGVYSAIAITMAEDMDTLASVARDCGMGSIDPVIFENAVSEYLTLCDKQMGYELTDQWVSKHRGNPALVRMVTKAVDRILTA